MENDMAKKNTTPHRTPRDLREISDYYKLNTKAVEDLASADKDNTPQYSEEELRRYRSKSKLPLPHWLKVLLLKAWFAGAVCFFIFWGLGVYLQNNLDMMLVFGLALGVVTDLLVNSILRYYAETETSNNKWMMFPKKNYLFFFCNIFYAYLLLLCVNMLYQVINRGIIALTGAVDTVPLGVEPILFGIFYMGFDMLFISVKHTFQKIISDAKSSVR